MGATEILRVLEKKGEPLSMLEISKNVDCNLDSLRSAMARLLNDISSGVKVKRLTPEEIKQKYGKHKPGRIFIYWIEK